MKNRKLISFAVPKLGSLLLLSLLTAPAWAFNSGSTGADGAFAPTTSTSIVLPANGILNFTTLNVPSGVTVKFVPNTANTPAFILVQGDAVIDGTIDISGVDGETLSTPPPGGFAGGLPLSNVGGSGQGPGGSAGGINSNGRGGNGGSYGTLGSRGTFNIASLGLVYGSSSIQPLLGGSGGGAVGFTSSQPGNRGGSGGGALLLAVSGTLTLNGAILVKGGNGAPSIVNASPGAGGGSGGAVRLIASTLAGSGTVDINGGAGALGGSIRNGGAGGSGRARLEADAFNFTGSVTPNLVVTSTPRPVFAANLPTVRITTVGGSVVPASPTGENDVILPSSIINPVTVEFAATGVPLGSTIELTVTPGVGTATTSTSTGLVGTVADSSASAQATLPNGASILLASVSFAVTTTTASLFTPFTNGEMVALVELRSTLGGGPSSMKLTTQSGKIIEVPAYAAKL